MKLFIPITKVDAAQRLVYGRVVAEEPDQSGEIFDYETSKPLFQAWSSSFEKATDGKSMGNLRAMHGSVAAGKFTDMVFEDADKAIDACAKVVDDAEWAKVEQGVYTGFSIGGKYEKRWKDGDLMRYTAAPVEVSLVDNPCIPSATFSMIKADGSTELRKFNVPAPVAEPTNDQIVAMAKSIAKDAGDESKWADQIEAARAQLVKNAATKAHYAKLGIEMEDPNLDLTPVLTPLTNNIPTAKSASSEEPEPELEQVWKAKDGSTHKKKADAIKHNEDLAAKAVASPLTDALAALKDAVGTAEGKRGIEQPEKAEEAKTEAAKAADAAKPEAEPAKRQFLVKRDLAKGLYDIARMAAILDDLNWLQQCLESEALWEGDNSPVPAQLKTNIGGLITTLKALVDEETAELMGDDGVDVDVVEMAAKPIARKAFECLVKAANEKAVDLLTKAGARHSAADAKRVQTMHDTSVDLGATCDSGADKAAPVDELAKVTAERDQLKRDSDNTAAQMRELAKVIETDIESRVNKRIDELMKMPAPSVPAQMHVIEKGQDAAALAKFAEAHPEEMALALIKASQRLPQQAHLRGN